MPTRTARLALCAAAFLAAGCLSAPPPEGDPGGGGPIAAPPTELHLDGCTGFEAATQFVPDALSPADPPEGWEEDPWPAAVLFLSLFDCSRLALGGFERSVRLLAETHTDLAVPASCARDSAAGTEDLALHALWADDPEVAAFLNATYGIPAGVAAFQHAQESVGPATVHTWTWSVAGHPSSELRFAQGEPTATKDVERLYWARGHGIGSLSLAYERDRAAIGPLASTAGAGAVAKPMLMASLPGSAFAGQVEPYPALQADGTFILYRDAGCIQRELAP